MAQPLITVLGAGSIGCYLGGRLQQGGAKVRFIGRPRVQEAIEQSGLRLSKTGDDIQPLAPIDFETETGALEGSDIIALCVKSQDTADAAKAIKTHAPKALVISFQNGVSNLPALRAHIDHVSGAVVPFNVTAPEPGLYHKGTDGPLVIGPEAPDAVVDALRAAGEMVQVEANIEGYLWAKLLVNLNNALNTLSGGPLRDGLLQRDYRRVLIAMIREGLSVAEAEGVSPTTFNGRAPAQLLKLMDKPDWLYKFLMDRIAKIDRKARSSMLDDLELGRSPELDYLQGEIVRRGKRLGVPTPVNAAVLEETQKAFAQKKSLHWDGAMMRQTFLFN